MQKALATAPFYERVKNLCTEKGFSISKMAVDLGFGNSAPTYWKRGRTPNGNDVQKIATYLKTTSDHLLNGSGNVTLHPVDLKQSDNEESLYSQDNIDTNIETDDAPTQVAVGTDGDTTEKFINLIDKLQTQSHERELKNMSNFHEREVKLIETGMQHAITIRNLSSAGALRSTN